MREVTREAIRMRGRKTFAFELAFAKLTAPAIGQAQSSFASMPRLAAGRAIIVFVPALDVREIGQVHLVALMAPGPAEDGEIGDRHRARDELVVGEPAVEHAVEPARLLHVALQAVAAVLLVLHRDEMVHLAGHRAEAAHLPHQPFQHRDALDQRLGRNLPVFSPR